MGKARIVAMKIAIGLDILFVIGLLIVAIIWKSWICFYVAMGMAIMEFLLVLIIRKYFPKVFDIR